MTQGKLKAVVIMIVAMLAIAVVCSWFLGKDQEEETTQEPVVISTEDTTGNTGISTTDGTTTVSGGSSGVTITPQPQTQTQTQQPASQTIDTGKETVQTTPTPEPTPAPTPEPTPVPEETYGKKLGSTSFSNSVVDGMVTLSATATAETYSATQVKVDVTVSVTSYAIYLNESTAGVGISVNGVAGSAGTPAVAFDGPGTATTTLCTKSFLVDLSQGESKSMPIAIEWYYNGTYHQQPIGTIECGGYFDVSRA